MKQNRMKGYAILGILFLAVSVVAFVVPVERTAAFWLTYAFTVVVFAAQIPVWKTALGREDTLKSKFLGLPVVHVGVVYLVVQVLILALFRFVATLPLWSAAAANVVIAALAAVCMIGADVGRGEIWRTEERVEKKASYLRSLQADVELLAGRETDPAVRSELVRLAEKIRFSDPMSHAQLAGLEEEIAGKAAQLKTAEDKGEIMAQLDRLLDERNKKCLTLK